MFEAEGQVFAGEEAYLHPPRFMPKVVQIKMCQNSQLKSASNSCTLGYRTRR